MKPNHAEPSRRAGLAGLAALALAFSLAVLPGCGGGDVDEGVVATENPPEIEEANANMEKYMESGGDAPAE